MLLYHGVSFFLARSKANKTPVPAFKIQQKGKKISRKVTKVSLLLRSRSTRAAEEEKGGCFQVPFDILPADTFHCGHLAANIR